MLLVYQVVVDSFNSVLSELTSANQAQPVPAELREIMAVLGREGEVKYDSRICCVEGKIAYPVESHRQSAKQRNPIL